MRNRSAAEIIVAVCEDIKWTMMNRDELGGFPYEAKKIGDLTILKFYPRPTARHPNQSVIILKIDKNSREKLLKLLAT